MNCSELLHSSDPRFLERVGAGEEEFAAFSDRWQREGFPAWLAERRIAGLRPQAEAQAAASARLEARLAAEAEAPYQPQYSRRPKRGPTSRYLGVNWHVPLAKWRTQVRVWVCAWVCLVPVWHASASEHRMQQRGCPALEPTKGGERSSWPDCPAKLLLRCLPCPPADPAGREAGARGVLCP